MKYCFLLPAYKVRFFDEALHSILFQSYKDFEVIVSDDCSPENLKQVVDKYNDPRVKYHRNEFNIGAENLVNHWNLLLNLTEANYIIMASDDDIYDTNYLESIDNLISSFPNVKIFRPRVRKIDTDGNTIFEENAIANHLNLNDYLDLWSTLNISTGIPYYVFDRKSLLMNGGFVHFPYAWFSDDATVIKQASIGGIAVTDNILFSFRCSPFSISSSGNVHSVKEKFYAAEQFYNFVTNIKENKRISQNTFESTKKYIQYISKNEFLRSGKRFSIFLIACFNASYASVRWKLGLLKQSLLNLF